MLVLHTLYMIKKITSFMLPQLKTNRADCLELVTVNKDSEVCNSHVNRKHTLFILFVGDSL